MRLGDDNYYTQAKLLLYQYALLLFTIYQHPERLIEVDKPPAFTQQDADGIIQCNSGH